MKRNLLFTLTFLLTLFFGTAAQAVAEVPGTGFSMAELLNWSGLVAVLLALAGIVLVEFVFKGRVSRAVYKWMLFIVLFIFPVFVMFSAFSSLMEETKTVSSCASCHVMDPFVDDMFDRESPNLAARHYKNKWIPDNQCYHCHTGYGVHGTLEAKRDGFRHWLMYVTETWPEPIHFKGAYPNQNCNTCHYDTPKFDAVQSHVSIMEKLINDEVSCASCHGPVHPTPNERPKVTETMDFNGAENTEAIKDYLRHLSPRE